MVLYCTTSAHAYRYDSLSPSLSHTHLWFEHKHSHDMQWTTVQYSNAIRSIAIIPSVHAGLCLISIKSRRSAVATLNTVVDVIIASSLSQGQLFRRARTPATSYHTHKSFAADLRAQLLSSRRTLMTLDYYSNHNLKKNCARSRGLVVPFYFFLSPHFHHTLTWPYY